MKISDFSVNRPIATLMLTLIIIVVGFYGLLQLKIDLLPTIQYPLLTISTTYQGVAPEEVEKMVTTPIEEVVSTVSDVKEVRSTTHEGISLVQVEFNWGTDLGEASNEIRDRLNKIVDHLPEGVDQPLILKFDLNQMPMFVMSMYSDQNRDIYEMKRYGDDIIKPFFEHIDGVASAMVVGAWPKEFQVLLDRDRLYAYGISYEQLVQKIMYENLNVSGGHITKGLREYSVRSLGEFKTADELANLVISVSKDGVPIRLSDIAVVREAPKEERGFGKFKGKRAMAIIILKQGDANTVDVANKIKKNIPLLEQKLPDDIHLVINFDNSSMITKSIRNTGWAAIEGGILAFFIVLLFLRNIRPTFVVSIAIPTSLMAGFAVLYFKDLTLNIMTLGGLTIAIGRLVDDAIVVTENTFRHLTLGEDRFTSAKKGASEVGVAITSSTLVTIAVFFPLIFVKGIAGELFRPFGYAVISAMLASLLVALTIVPMISSRILSRFAGAEREIGLYYRFREWYGNVLRSALKHKWKVLIGAMALFFASLLLLIPIKKEFIPSMEEEYTYMTVSLPTGTKLDTTGKALAELSNNLMNDPDVDVVFNFYGESSTGGGGGGFGEASSVSRGFFIITLKPKNERTSSYTEFLNRVRRYGANIPDMKLNLMDVGSFIMGGTRPIDIRITGFDLDRLEKISEEIENVLKSITGIVDIDNALEKGAPELQISYNREKLSRYGLTVGQVASIVSTALEGKVISRIHKEGEEYDLRLRFLESDRKTIEDIENIPISSPLGFNIMLRDIATISEERGPENIFHKDLVRMGEIRAGLNNRTLGEATSEIKNKIKSIEDKLPIGYQIEFAGQYKNMMETFQNLFFVLLFSFLLVYMIMAASFESLVHPLAIMFSIPFAFTGAFVSLFIANKSLDIESFIGLIFLVGIVVTNAIVFIDFVNQLRRQKGYDIDDALVEAGKIRLRPILMTAFATIFAMVPLALALRAGEEMEQGMAIAVIGGLFTSTILTLIIVPIVYKILDDWAGRLSRRATKMLHGDEEKI
ncbi:MAG: efflux RND transporter permease subunit [bacterium]